MVTTKKLASPFGDKQRKGVKQLSQTTNLGRAWRVVSVILELGDRD